MRAEVSSRGKRIEGKRVSIQQGGRMCVGSFARANTQHPQAEEAERQNGTAHRSEMREK